MKRKNALGLVSVKGWVLAHQRILLEGSSMATRKICRDARTGRIIPVREAERRKAPLGSKQSCCGLLTCSR
jgi:hypothetical protein